jgi:DnaA family protein
MRQQLALRMSLREASRFSTFEPGGNTEAVARLQAQTPGSVTWLWGRSGVGKTHLLQAACAAAGERGETAAYADLAGDRPSASLDGLESVSLICLDDFDRVATAADWNEAIFRLHTFMPDVRSRLVIASRAAPAGLELALSDLRSRLLAGDLFQLKELDDDGLVAALQRRAQQRGLELSAEGAQYLLQRLPRDMHSLCRALDRLDEASLAAQRKLTLPFLREALSAQASVDDG